MALARPGKWPERGFKSLKTGFFTGATSGLSARRRSSSSRQASARLPNPRPEEARNSRREDPILVCAMRAYRLLFIVVDSQFIHRSPSCDCELDSLTQRGNRAAAIADDRMGTALRIGPLAVEVNFEVAENCGRQVGGNHSPILEIITALIRAAEHLTMLCLSAGHEHRHAIRPVGAAPGH